MITIDTKPTGETTLFIAAESIMAAIRTLDRARAALAALDDSPEPEPVTAEQLAALIALVTPTPPQPPRCRPPLTSR